VENETISYEQYISGETINKNLNFSNNKTYLNNNGSATINNTTPQVIINDQNQEANIIISSGTNNPKINLESFISNGSGTLPAINITSANANNVNVSIPDSTNVTSADQNWNGVMTPPTITSVVIPKHFNGNKNHQHGN
jgi:hypothetical protein